MNKTIAVLIATLTLSSAVYAAEGGAPKPVRRAKTTDAADEARRKGVEAGKPADEVNQTEAMKKAKDGKVESDVEKSVEELSKRANVSEDVKSSVRSQLSKTEVREALKVIDETLKKTSNNGRAGKNAEALTGSMLRLLAKADKAGSAEVIEAFSGVFADALDKGYDDVLTTVLNEGLGVAETGVDLKTAIEGSLSKHSKAKSIEELRNCKKA